MKNKLIVVKEKMLPVVRQAETISISDSKSLLVAVDVLSKLNKFKDKITNEKEKITKPLNQALKAERARWKPLETFYENAIEIIREKMSEYQTKAQEKLDNDQTRLAEEVTKGLPIEEAMKEMGELATAVKADMGSVTFITVKKFEIIDIGQLPVDYILPNETKIREAMKDGKLLDGVRYYETQEPRNYR